MTKTEVMETKRMTTAWTCPICGRPFTAVDMVVFEHEENYQCRYCWNRLRSGTPDSSFRTNVQRVKLSKS
jgi:hypothetical protein